jgi:1-acyl-sn-glycerol-3-phosphate acyltransferase
MIDRKRSAGHDNPLLPMEQAIEAGDSLIIFPEGTRKVDEDADLAPFKAGLYNLALRYPHLELVPVHLVNLNRILPKGELILVPLLAAVRFGTPIRPLADETKEDFLQRARSAVASLEDASE